jgi:phosphoribosylformimino-5-aminoimidazole carboxamide ribotide isomerase
VVVGLDAREGRVAVRGWMDTSETRAVDLVRRFEELPLGAVLYTDILRDGTLEGPNVEATTELAGATRHPVIASGGVGSLADLVALAQVHVISAAVVGRALYDGRLDLGEALRELSRC